MKSLDTSKPYEPRADFILHLQSRLNVSRREARAMLMSWMEEVVTAKPRSEQEISEDAAGADQW